GYLEEADPTNNTPDVVFLVGAWAVTNTNAYIGYPWWDWWGWYPGWGCCGPGYGWGYPSAPVVVRYDTATLVITMVDPNRAAVDEIPVVWVAGMNGVLGSGGTTIRITDGIDQAFDQSPYLRTN
ncbi:MAG: DUF4136 domain-containing protein, partial [Gemmatimonadetes bacterium]|nr:DUF4136 domain-containing protein [Gemmatimonadota bacterium]